MAAPVSRLYLKDLSFLPSSKPLHFPFSLSPMFLAILAEKNGAQSSYITSRVSYEQLFKPEPQWLLPLPLAMAKTPVSYGGLPPASYSCFNRVSPSGKTRIKAAFGTCAPMGLTNTQALVFHFHCHSLE